MAAENDSGDDAVAHGTDQAEGAEGTDGAVRRATASAAKFVREHGGSARGVPERLGRAGVRLVLIGADGVLGDVMVADADQATAVVEAVADLERGDWDAETTAALTIGPEHRRAMAGPRAHR